MPTLKSILKPNQNLVIHFGNEIVNIQYRPNYLTPEFEENLKGLKEEEKVSESFLTMFCSLISAWDLKMDDSDALPIPIERDSLKVIPYEILGEILNKVQEAIIPNQPMGLNSDATSQQAVESAQFQNGTH